MAHQFGVRPVSAAMSRHSSGFQGDAAESPPRENNGQQDFGGSFFACHMAAAASALRRASLTD